MESPCRKSGGLCFYKSMCFQVLSFILSCFSDFAKKHVEIYIQKKLNAIVYESTSKMY